RERQHLAALRVEDDDASGFRAVARDGRLQLVEGEKLDSRIDRQGEVAARLRRADRGDVLDRVAAPIDDHAARPRLAGEPRLLRELDALLTAVAVSGEPDEL